VPEPAQLRTERLLLRRWREADRGPWAALNDDPEVMEHFPSRLTRAESDEFFDRIAEGLDEQGWGLWATERVDTGELIGMVGLAVPSFVSHFTPAVEVGWRLARPHWGHGFATEAARASIDYGFRVLELDEIVAMTTLTNVRSQRVMVRLGMTRDPDDDFDHPRVADGPLRRHVLYRLRRPYDGR
jgi:ribosomal-protein-alanine N-acetyltransferase